MVFHHQNYLSKKPVLLMKVGNVFEPRANMRLQGDIIKVDGDFRPGVTTSTLSLLKVFAIIDEHVFGGQ